MVTTQGRKLKKPVKSKKSGRRVRIRQNIPFDESEHVTRTEISRKIKNRIVTKSTRVFVSATLSGPSNLPDPSLPPPSDVENPPSVTSKATRKGPSRSAAVRFLSSRFHQKTNTYSDQATRMASAQGGIFR